jgi:hypothetical protein
VAPSGFAASEADLDAPDVRSMAIRRSGGMAVRSGGLDGALIAAFCWGPGLRYGGVVQDAPRQMVRGPPIDVDVHAPTEETSRPERARSRHRMLRVGLLGRVLARSGADPCRG